MVSSRRDREALEGLASRYLSPGSATAPVTAVTNGVDLEYFHPQENGRSRDRRTVIFTGKMSYHANIAGVLFFSRQVLPIVWAQDPDVRFQIVGKDPPEAVHRLAADRRIQVTGTVPDLRPYLARATVAVCPVPYAVGVQLKVLEAMAMATPVVCSSASFAGLEAQPGYEALVADSPDVYAAQILQICSSPALAERLADAGRRYVETNHSWEDSARQLLEVYGEARRDNNEG